MHARKTFGKKANAEAFLAKKPKGHSGCMRVRKLADGGEVYYVSIYPPHTWTKIRMIEHAGKALIRRVEKLEDKVRQLSKRK